MLTMDDEGDEGLASAEIREKIPKNGLKIWIFIKLIRTY